MAAFKGLAWNCGGLKSSTASCKKALYFENQHGNDFDIAFFMETHHRTESEISPEILRYKTTIYCIHTIYYIHRWLRTKSIQE